MILRICDRFRTDPDTAAGLDASVLGLIDAETLIRSLVGS